QWQTHRTTGQQQQPRQGPLCEETCDGKSLPSSRQESGQNSGEPTNRPTIHAGSLMIRLLCCLAATGISLLALPGAPAYANEPLCAPATFEQKRMTVCTIDPTKDDL